jgi:hypothetical protein
MEGDEIVCRFTTMDMVGVIKQTFVKTEVSAIVDDHPSKKQVMMYTLHMIEPHINAHLPIHIYSLCCHHILPVLCNSSLNSHCDKCFVRMQFHRCILQEGCWYKTLETSLRWYRLYGFNENLCVWSLNYELKVFVQKSKRLQSNVGYPKHVHGMHFGVCNLHIL